MGPMIAEPSGRDGTAGPPRKGLVLRYAIFLAVALLTRALFLGAPCLDLDEAAQLVGARVLLGGGTLYVDVVDNRPPLLYAYYALAQLVVGDGIPGVRLLATLTTLPLTALACSAFFRHGRRGLAAGLLYLVYGAAFLAHDMHSASPELLMLLPLAWALVLVRDAAGARSVWRLLAAGTLIGVAALFRQQAALAWPALAWAAWRAGVDGEDAQAARRTVAVRNLAGLASGFGIPLAVTAALFAARGAGHELAFWTFLHNLRYAANPIPASEAAERVASYLLPFLAVTAPLWWASRSLARLDGSRHRDRLVKGLLAALLLAAFLGFRFFPHYLVPLYLPLALGAAPWTAAAVEAPGRGRRFALGWAAAMLAGFTLANAALYSGRFRVYEETRPVFKDVARHLRSDPCFGGPLFVWGFAPQFYAESALPPASRFIMPQASLTGYVPGNRTRRSDPAATKRLVRQEHWDQLLADLARRPPTFVLDTAPSGLHGWDRYPIADQPRLETFLKESYQATAIVDGIWIWRRRGCVPVRAGAS